MSNILITGGAGFIGSNFVHYWKQQHPSNNLFVLDALTYAGNLPNINSLIDSHQIKFYQGNICNTELVESILTHNNIDTIVNFAAESHVDRSIDGPDAFIETNVIGTHSLLKAARKIWLDNRQTRHHRFHHISTDEVFGSLESNDPMFKESNQYLPNSPYSASKAASDHIVRAYHHTYGLNVTTSNCSNNYGPYHFPEKLVPLCITNILHGKNLPIYGDGKNIRDWLYVDDHCRGIDLILQNGVSGETYNIGGNNEWDNISLVNLLCETVDNAFRTNPELKSKYPQSPASNNTKSNSLITYVADRPGHDKRYAIDTYKIQTKLGYKPRVMFESGLKKTVDWYLNNPEWWTPLL